ncbi:MAG: methyltransferase [Proteobacteria bacterium]|nr:methyltransferase [Pseudomonadota bacterium]
MSALPQPIPAAQDASVLYRLVHDAESGYKQLQALRVALSSGLFEQLEQGLSATQLAQKLGLDPGLTLALCRVLAEMGLLEKKDSEYHNTGLVQTFLRRSSPLYQGSVVSCVQASLAPWEQLEEMLHTGPAKHEGGNAFAGDFIHALAAETLTGELQKTTDILCGVLEFSQVRTLLDLGGGHGLYSLALCQRNPKLRATIFDLPGMAEAATRYSELFGDGRLSFATGNQFTDPIGEDYDAVLLSYNPGGKSRALLDKVHAALKPGGLFITKHAYYAKDEGSKNPLLDLEWAMTVFPGVDKEPHIYRFKNDLAHEEILHYLAENYDILRIAGVHEFALGRLGKMGDRLDSQLIVARKRQSSHALGKQL